MIDGWIGIFPRETERESIFEFIPILDTSIFWTDLTEPEKCPVLFTSVHHNITSSFLTSIEVKEIDNKIDSRKHIPIQI